MFWGKTFTTYWNGVLCGEENSPELEKENRKKSGGKIEARSEIRNIYCMHFLPPPNLLPCSKYTRRQQISFEEKLEDDDDSVDESKSVFGDLFFIHDSVQSSKIQKQNCLIKFLSIQQKKNTQKIETTDTPRRNSREREISTTTKNRKSCFSIQTMSDYESDEEYGWEKPAWAKGGLKLKSTGVADAMKKEGNLAAPITFTPYKNDDHTNYVASPEILKKTENSTKMKTEGNLANPITHIRDVKIKKKKKPTM